MSGLLEPLALPDAEGVEDEDGALLDEDEDDGLLGLLEPLAALPLGEAGAVDELELDAPPEAPAAGVLGEALDEELELLSVDDGGVAEPETEPDAEPEGAVVLEGGVVEPADEDVLEPGARAPVFVAASRSQPASRLAPSAMDTATARVESFM